MTDTLFDVPGSVGTSAVLSDCRRYRYTLVRRWGEGPAVLFLMLNPSTADANVDDPTIRRCMGFARSWGYDALLVWNLYGYRATDPSELDRVDDPIGRENEDHLWALRDAASLIVAAWGARPGRGRYTARETSVLHGPIFERQVHVLRLTQDGHPHHPLRLPGNLKPMLWKDVREA